jgi:uncharacterized protein (DUF1778 family)
MSTDKERISLYVDPEKKEELKRLAKIRKRSLNSMIDVIFDDVLEKAKQDGELS